MKADEMLDVLSDCEITVPFVYISSYMHAYGHCPPFLQVFSHISPPRLGPQVGRDGRLVQLAIGGRGEVLRRDRDVSLYRFSSFIVQYPVIDLSLRRGTLSTGHNPIVAKQKALALVPSALNLSSLQPSCISTKSL